MVINTLDVMGRSTAGIARRIEQTSGDLLAVYQARFILCCSNSSMKDRSPPSEAHRRITTTHALSACRGLPQATPGSRDPRLEAFAAHPRDESQRLRCLLRPARYSCCP